jgi:hypothetical protein
VTEQLWADRIVKPGHALLDDLHQVYFINTWSFTVHVLVTIPDGTLVDTNPAP